MPTFIAVLGTGSAGTHHLNALRGVGGIRPLAVPLRPERAAELRAAGFETASGLEEAFALGVRACVIATETGRHAVDGLAALELGMHVLLEKPLAASAAEARSLVEAAKKRDRGLHVACPLRFSASLGRFRAMLPDIGALHSVRVECRSFLPDWRPERPYRETYSARASDGGVLRDMIHDIDYAGWLFGWPDAVAAMLSNTGRLGIEAEEAAELAWTGRAGESVTVGLDYLTRTPRRGIVAHGADGTLEWDAIAQAVTLCPAGKPAVRSVSAQPRAELFLEQARAFARTSAGGPGGPLASGEDGLLALAVCDAARLSAGSLRREAVQKT